MALPAKKWRSVCAVHGSSPYPAFLTARTHWRGSTSQADGLLIVDEPTSALDPEAEIEAFADAGRGDQLSRIRLDPTDHDMWAVHDLATWQELTAPRAFARLDAIERARLNEDPAYLTTHT